MLKQEEGVRFLLKLSKVTSNINADGDEHAHRLLRRIDITPFKAAHAWPGRSYLLVGNSFNVENEFADAITLNKRSARIALLLENGHGNRGCVAIGDALNDADFVEILSRFERDWLKRLPESTLIGPAYNQRGDLISQAFSVWRRESEIEYVCRKPLMARRSS